ncbi:hypothetical protein OSB04_017969 [Centaurea solstitialis]|uniref:Reverse transcriptase domain-containing protein n=1 Tax=Centaurea solstitialis TaxID=347529 RepID=A0AA38WL87_9ASTR|nr:hypothetical protein OSB04_017969 [Centaurea solstitialis]
MPKRVDWDLLRSMSVENNIKAILEKHAYDEDGNEYYICHAWERVFDIAETLYRELIVEFVATFHFEAIKALAEFHQSCMTFRLGGVWRSLSLIEFALALGIYTQSDVDAPGFEEYMWATAKRPDDFDPCLAWSILGDGDYHGNLKVKGFLASSDRLLHRMLIQAVNARSSSEEKVTVQDLWLLEQLSTDDKYPNAPYLIAAQLAKASGYREGSRIVGGQYVTLLAKHFGILTDAAIASMTNLGEMGLIDMDQLRGMGVARVEHMVGRDYNAWIHDPQAYRSQPRNQPSQARSEAPRSTHEIGGTSGANVGQQPADWTAYSDYQDLSNRLSEMLLSYGRHQQHMEYNTVEALHQANWSLIKQVNCSLVALQETKCENIEDWEIRKIWGTGSVDAVFSKSRGASGGTLMIWDANLFQKESFVSEDHFCVVVGHWAGVDSKVGFINVYGPQLSNAKANLWCLLQNIISSAEHIWVLMGDFNAIRSRNEKIGLSFDNRDAMLFNNFILSSSLHDIQLGARRFTRFSKDGKCMSKLDRFLVNQRYLTQWRCVQALVLPRSFSDHSPIVLKVDDLDFGPKPFKVFDHWNSNEDYVKLVAASWGEGSFRGTADVVLKNKLKKLRNDIRVWVHKEIAKSSTQKDLLASFLLDWDSKAESSALSEEDLRKREDALFNHAQIENKERLEAKQKSRLKWAIEGDENSKFFHAMANQRCRIRSLKGLICNGLWSEDPSKIKDAAFNFFASRFKEPVQIQATFSSPSFKKISSEDASMLEAPFSIEEIEAAVNSCEGSKAPGPDGVNFNFIKKHWSTIKHSFVEAVFHFERSGFIKKGCNASFVALVPKKRDPLELGDFRPISLLGCYYKVIAKILYGRLSKVMDKIISGNQTAFIKGRQILDGCLIANEVVSYASKKNLKLLLLKVDFEKAFDSVNWSFLISVMKQMGFGQKWCHWIMGCLNSASVSVLVNGSPTPEFNMERGLRQGDPLSPLLFLIVGEALQIMTLEACKKGIFKGLYLASSNRNISLLQYADDVLFLGKWSMRNIYNLTLILECFYDVSGLRINLSKSSLLGIGVADEEVEDAATKFKCSHAKLPFSYLGLPVGSNMRLKRSWDPILEKFQKKLASWKGNLLSIGGRLTLVNSVLSALPLYYFSLFKTPKGVLNILESTRRRFLWGNKQGENKVTWIAWDKTVKSRNDGGLGITGLIIKNQALLAKWIWRFLKEDKSLWKEVITELHGGVEKVLYGSTINGNGLWNSIMLSCRNLRKVGVDLCNSFYKSIVAGSQAEFWDDPNVGGGVKLKERFPRLFALESNPRVLFKDRWLFVRGSWQGNWEWRSILRGRSLEEFHNLIELLSSAPFKSSGIDNWHWKWDDKGLFSVKKLSEIIQMKTFPSSSLPLVTYWSRFLPRKVNVFIWRLRHNALPTKENLEKRGINIASSSLSCVFCDSHVETLDHCFFGCRLVEPVWRKIWAWWGLSSSRPSTVDNFVSSASFSANQRFPNGIFKDVCYIALWSIWRWRNSIWKADEANAIKARAEDVFPGIMRQSALWISSRRTRPLILDSWSSCPWNSVF